MKTISKQRKWQIKKRAEGKCECCGKDALDDHRFCSKHLERNRHYSRIRTRIRLGIPLDQAVRKGHPICVDWAYIEPEKYTCRYQWARNNLKKSPEELEAKAQDLLIFANMLRKYQHKNP